MDTPNNEDLNAKTQDRHDPSTRKASTETRNQRAPVPPERKQSPKTISEVVDGYLQKRERKVESEQLSERTFDTDRRSLKLLQEWIEAEYHSLTVTEAEDVGLREFKEFRLQSVSPTTVAKNLRHIKSFFSDLVQREVISSNPAKRVDIPKTRRTDIIPKQKEFKALKEWLDKQIGAGERPRWIHLLMKLACNTGMRLGELIQIKWERGPKDVGTGHSRNYVYLDVEEKTLTIKFKRKPRVIPVSHVWSVFERLRQRQEPEKRFVFASPNGGHYDDSYVCRQWKEEVRRVDQLSHPYTCHTIRHAVVTSLLRKNYSAHKIGQFVGHSSEQITERYGHLIASDLNEMASTLAD